MLVLIVEDSHMDCCGTLGVLQREQASARGKDRRPAAHRACLWGREGLVSPSAGWTGARGLGSKERRGALLLWACVLLALCDMPHMWSISPFESVCVWITATAAAATVAAAVLGVVSAVCSIM